MNHRIFLDCRDCLFLLGAVFFFFGCIASSHRSGRTLAPKQTSLGVSYLQAENLEEPEVNPVQLIALDGRIGAIRGLDLGVMHTWDVSKENDNMYATFWGDVKVQMGNRTNKVGTPYLSSGLMKGYAYHEQARLHITTIPITLSVPAGKGLIPYITYRHEWITNNFIPDNFSDPRTTFILGLEMELRRSAPHQLTPKIGLSLGWFNSLIGGEGADGLILNFGFYLESTEN